MRFENIETCGDEFKASPMIVIPTNLDFVRAFGWKFCKQNGGSFSCNFELWLIVFFIFIIFALKLHLDVRVSVYLIFGFAVLFYEFKSVLRLSSEVFFKIWANLFAKK